MLITLFLVVSGTLKSAPLISPNGELSVEVFINSVNQANYRISRNEIAVILDSRLGLQLEDRDISNNLNLISVSGIKSVQQHYQLFTGKQSEVSYQANQQSYLFKNINHQQVEVVFRVSNDGVAFKYRLLTDPKSFENKQVKLIDENTSFSFPQNTKGWLQHAAVARTGWSNTNPSYEEHYQMGIPVGQVSPSKAGWVFPALFKPGNSNDTWVAITESGLSANFHASRLQSESPNGEYKIGKPMAKEVFTEGDVMATDRLPFTTPWRVIAVGDLATIADSTLGTDLADPMIEMDTSFVKPGIAAWSWGLLKDDSINYATQKEFIDYAAEMKWQYSLIDVNWDTTIGYKKIQDLIDYARSKDVGIFLWYNSAGNWNTTPYHPKGKLLTQKKREKEFSKLAKMGVKGVKIDFFAGDGQSMIDYYHQILRDAAKYKLLVNFHGATLPRGWHRTYPHLLTVEAVKGFEMISFFQQSADLEASHSAMLPFTRNLFDPMDFTPTTLNDIPNIIRKTTNAFALAQTILFTSGIQHIVETPEGMKHTPDFAKQFLQKLPTRWHESKFISGYPGELAVFARRHKNTWYIAGINGEKTVKKLLLNLDFVQGKKAQLIQSGSNERALTSKEIFIENSTSINLAGNDGFIIKVTD